VELFLAGRRYSLKLATGRGIHLAIERKIDASAWAETGLDPEILYEECADCPPGGGCMTCWDLCVVPHEHAVG
jgi:hypothetical protein